MGESANGVPVPRLATLRKRAGMSQRELAERAGVGKNTISRLEQGGNARSDTIEQLAQALGTKRTTLVQPLRHTQARQEVLSDPRPTPFQNGCVYPPTTSISAAFYYVDHYQRLRGRLQQPACPNRALSGS